MKTNPTIRLRLAARIASDINALCRVTYDCHGFDPLTFPPFLFVRLLTSRTQASRWWDWIGDVRDYYGDSESVDRFAVRLDDTFSLFMTI